MSAVTAPTQQLLAWLDERERTYAETVEVWHSHCPRLTIWEDALAEGLVEVVRSAGRRGATVLVTPRGRAAAA